MLKGKVLITGGAGFLGRGIMRKAKRENWPCEFTIFSRDEFKQHLCRDKYPNAGYVLGDIRDNDRLALVMRGHDVVVHAAALKYVPEAEFNVDECIGINVAGSQSVVRAAREAKVKTVVAISTDKAVEPVNTYGLTKALAERIFYEAARLIPEIKFVTCRYGNVIGSTGSVIPVFKKQMEQFGHVKVTDPHMTRYWLPIDDAVKVVEITADALASGSILVHVPKATTIGAIAEHISGGKMEIVGTRPGEKLHETLLTTKELQKCFFGSMFDLDFYKYQSDGPVLNNSLASLTSENADAMEPFEFFEHVADAETV